MKARIFYTGGLALMLALAPLIGGCDNRANSATVTNVPTTQAPTGATAMPTDANQPADDMDATADDGSVDTNAPDLANAQGTIISAPETGTTNSNNAQITDFVKLVQAGVGEPVLMAYVTNSPGAFNLSSDDVVYLNDLGAPETVVAAMLQRDKQLLGTSAEATQPQQPQQPAYPYANPVPTPETAMPPQQYEMPATDQTAMAEAPTVEPPLTPTEEAAVDQSPNESYSYFYDSLAPYGTWVNIAGYGPCWQPTVVVGNPGWQPYCDRGHWAYTDCGWVWVSDYSWGWAPFHYGRWFHNTRFGWCWAPDTVWGPAWVSWRYSDAFCGWAPLPPTACYRPGFGFTWFGRSVGIGFGFGLPASRFTFVPIAHFHDRWPGRFRVPHQEITRVYNTTIVHNQIIRGNNNLLINRGIPVDRVAAATRTEIRPIHIRADATGPRASQLGRDGRTLSVFRPSLPMPRPGTASTRVGEGVRPDPNFNLRTHVNHPQPTPVVRSANPSMPSAPASDHRPIISHPTANVPPNSSRQNNGFNQPGGQRQDNSIYMRGPSRINPGQAQNPTVNNPPALRHGPEIQSTQPLTPADNNHRVVVTPPVQQQQQDLNRQNYNRQQFQQPQMPQQRQLQQEQPQVRTVEPGRFNGTPKMQDQNANSGSSFRSQPSYQAPQRSFDQPAQEYRSAPRQDFNPNAGRSYNGGGASYNTGGGGGGNHGGGGGGGNSSGGGGGGSSHGGGGGGGSGGGNGGGGGNNGGGNNGNGGGGGGHR